MSKRKGDFRSKIDSILADDTADGGSDAGPTGLDRMFGAESNGNTSDAMSRHVAPTTETNLDEIEVARIKLPRGRRVDADRELNDSIAKTGILQPLLLRPTASGFEVLDGGRRLAVARDRGLKTVPAVVRAIGDDEAKAMSAERKAVAVPAARKPASARPQAAPARSPRAKAAPRVAAPARRAAVATPVASAARPGRKAATPAARPVSAGASTRSAAAAKPVAAAKPKTARAAAAKASTPKPAAGKAATVKAAPTKVTKATAAAKGTPARSAAKPVTKPTPAKPAVARAAKGTAASTAAAAAATTAASAAAAEVAAPRPARNAPTRRGRAAAAASAGPDVTSPAADADETVVITRPPSTPSLARLAIPEESETAAAPQEAPKPATPAEDTIIWRRRDEPAVERPAAAASPAPSFPRPSLEPAPAQVAAASFRGTDVAPSQGGTGKLLADWVFFPLAACALAFSVTNLVIFSNTALFVEAGVVCIVSLVVFGVLYLAGRRA